MKQQGFTLIELIVTIAVVAVITALAVPSFNALVADYRVRSVASSQADALRKARSIAVRPGNRAPVTVTLSGNVDQNVRLTGSLTTVAFSPSGTLGSMQGNPAVFNPIATDVTYTFSNSNGISNKTYQVVVRRSGKVSFL